MDCFVMLLVVLGIAIVAIRRVAGGVGKLQPGARRALRQLASQYHGTFHGGGLAGSASARFRYGETWVTISQVRRRGFDSAIQARIRWPDIAPAVEIASRDGLAMTDATELPFRQLTSDEAFERRFTVRGPDRQAITKWLSEGVRWQLFRLESAFDRGGVFVSVRDRTMIIRKTAHLRRTDDFEQFTQLALELYDQAMLTRAEGIDFLNNGDAQPIEDPVCQVCGETIAMDMVFCRRCRTPHHLDCWQYVGKCSTYGCNETHYMVPCIAKEVERPRTNEEG